MVGNPRGEPPRRHGARPMPSTWDTSSTVNIIGSSSNELYLDFLIQFPFCLPGGRVYSLFCGAVFEPLTWVMSGHCSSWSSGLWPEAALPSFFSRLRSIWIHRAGLGDGVVPEDPAHVMEQPGHCQHRRGRTVFLQVAQKVLCILIALLGGLDSANVRPSPQCRELPFPAR